MSGKDERYYRYELLILLFVNGERVQMQVLKIYLFVTFNRLFYSILFYYIIQKILPRTGPGPERRVGPADAPLSTVGPAEGPATSVGPAAGPATTVAPA